MWQTTVKRAGGEEGSFYENACLNRSNGATVWNNGLQDTSHNSSQTNIFLSAWKIQQYKCYSRSAWVCIAPWPGVYATSKMYDYNMDHRKKSSCVVKIRQE